MNVGLGATVELPSAGICSCAIGEVFYWGGCGTCGVIYGGGTVSVNVVAGDTVTLELGVQTGAT